jgi:hypothetical protein
LAYSNEIEGFIAETLNERFGELDHIREVFHDMRNDAKKLRDDLILDVGKPNLFDLKKNVIAADGSNYQEQFESIAITIATAYVYMNNRQMERYLPSIKVVPPYYSSLVNSLRMKNLEYRVTFDVLKELDNDGENVNLILLDGAITFPDEAMADYVDNVPWIKKAYDEHRTIVNNFYNYAIERNIPIAAIVKDSMANKYFLSLYQALNNFQDNSELDMDFLDKNSNFIKSWGKDGKYNIISENSMLKMVFEDREFCRTKYAEVTCCLRNEIPTKILRGNVIGFYFKTIKSERPFFVEVPMQFKNNIDEITQLLSSFSYYSLRKGYPFPLYAAHKKVELKKKYAKSLARILRNMARKDLKNDYDLLFSDKFHEKI